MGNKSLYFILVSIVALLLLIAAVVTVVSCLYCKRIKRCAYGSNTNKTQALPANVSDNTTQPKSGFRKPLQSNIHTGDNADGNSNFICVQVSITDAFGKKYIGKISVADFGTFRKEIEGLKTLLWEAGRMVSAQNISGKFATYHEISAVDFGQDIELMLKELQSSLDKSVMKKGESGSVKEIIMKLIDRYKQIIIEDTDKYMNALEQRCAEVFYDLKEGEDQNRYEQLKVYEKASRKEKSTQEAIAAIKCDVEKLNTHFESYKRLKSQEGILPSQLIPECSDVQRLLDSVECNYNELWASHLKKKYGTGCRVESGSETDSAPSVSPPNSNHSHSSYSRSSSQKANTPERTSDII